MLGERGFILGTVYGMLISRHEQPVKLVRSATISERSFQRDHCYRSSTSAEKRTKRIMRLRHN